MRLEQIMSRGLVAVDPEDKVVDAARAMRERRVSAALVVRGGALVGIVTERDLAHKLVAEGLSPEGLLVRELMTPDPVTATPETSAWEAMSRMTVKGIRHLPVCEGDRPVGIVSIRDLASATADVARVQELVADLDERSRARLAEILLWVVDRVGLRREEVSLLPGEE